MLTFVKCVWANVVTRVGVLCLLFSVFALVAILFMPSARNGVFIFIGGYCFIAGFILCWGTGCSRSTIYTYHVVHERAERHGFVRQDSVLRMTEHAYCTRAGARLALRELSKKGLVVRE